MCREDVATWDHVSLRKPADTNAVVRPQPVYECIECFVEDSERAPVENPTRHIRHDGDRERLSVGGKHGERHDCAPVT